MSVRDDGGNGSSRRQFLGATTLATALASVGGAGLCSAQSALAAEATTSPHARRSGETEPFWGAHQAGILTPAQNHTYFMAFDLVSNKQADVEKLLQDWTMAAARMTAGMPAQDISAAFEPAQPATPSPQYATAPATSANSYAPPGLTAGIVGADTGEALELSPARLTLTFGFGAGFFLKDGKDRYGFAHLKPDALIDVPRFPGEQMDEARTGGDLSVQACADDQQVAFHAMRQLARIADGIAQIRWVQTGFLPASGTRSTPRNLMGFRDGTNNPPVGDNAAMEKIVWVGDESPAWLRGGSYLVARRIRVALEHWDRMTVQVQENTVGRHKYSGAPLGGMHERDPLNLAATDRDGNSVIPDNAHARLAAAETNDGARILRRPYSYNDGVNFTAERWPPWRQGLEYDAGLFFLCYQRDPRTGFIKINERLSRFDMMNQFITHVGGGLFVCPKGVAKGEFLGQGLFESA